MSLDKMLTVRERFLVAASGFCREEIALRSERARWKLHRCEFDGMEYKGRCAASTPPSELCPACQAFFSTSVYKGSLRKRYAAKRSMVAAYGRMLAISTRKVNL